MPPVKVHYYGIVWLTRSQYIWITAVLGVIVGALFLVLALVAADRFPSFYWPWEPMPANALPGWRGFLAHHIYTILGLLVLAEAIDIIVTLRKFRAKEAAARAAREEQS